MLAIHFGAGNIGRGFIGQLLYQSGYEVCFVDVNQELVNEISSRKEYQVRLADMGQETFTIQGVRAISGKDEEAVANVIANADLVTTAVGPNILKYIAPVIAKGISLRIGKSDQPLNVIACENMVGGSTQLKSYVLENIEEAVKAKVMAQIGFPDAAVDRIVPLQNHDDKLLVTVEPFYEWVVNESQFIGPVPKIEGITFVRDLTPYIERKLFTVNTGHAVTAYLGYQHGLKTIDQAMKNENIVDSVRQTLLETGQLLKAKHQFDEKKHLEYTDKIMNRFQNPFISDELIRVGRSPIRKLSPNDRLVGPAMQAFEHGITPIHLAKGIAGALLFDYPGDPEAVEIQNSIREVGMEETIRKYTQIPVDHPLFSIVMKQVDDLRKLEVK
ncbi:MAG TPA: mannitol-1-phosphate 5-dehydrogenase [Bacillota bacterium]|nr:mannitol-1-phosphate 5-dehydrogenase [Bacillota bacterium]